MKQSHPFIQAHDWKLIRQCEGRVVVGYSGGLDSHVLLHTVVDILQPQQDATNAVTALHINHGLSPQAEHWQAHCQEVCTALGVPLSTITVNVATHGSLEAAARDARYQAFRHFLDPGDLLLLAHHLDDHVETVLLHLLRGDSPLGLQGIPRQRLLVPGVRLLRPFLDVPRSIIEAHGRDQQLSWIEDESNSDTRFDRNYLRHKVLPLLKHRWPHLSTTISQSVERTLEVTENLRSVAESDLQELLCNGRVAITAFRRLPSLRQRHLMRAWLRRSGAPGNPADRMLRAGIDDLLNARPDASPVLGFNTLECRRFNGYLCVLPAFEAEPQAYDFCGDTIALRNGEVTANFSPGAGLRVDNIGDISIRFRCGGEEIKFDRTRSLKNILQENKFPAFLRDYLPLVYVNDELVAVCGIPAWGLGFVVSPHWKARGEAPGWTFAWDFL